ncbi:hypothetical protein BGZ60DRAFT_362507, partial [Tricladium varicosporioides]
DGGDEMAYIRIRPAGDNPMLGGCYQKGSRDSQQDPNLALRVMIRVVDLCPELGNKKSVEGLDLVRHRIGLSVAREGGIRIDPSWVDDGLVVYNYEHASFGY